MRKGRQQNNPLAGPPKRDLPEVFLRLCHYCLYLNESDKEIEQCERCEKCFSPKQVNHSYSYQDSDSETDSDSSLEQALDSLEEELETRPEEKAFGKTLVNGLNVKW